MTLEHSKQIYEQYSGIKFRENPSSGSRVFLCGKSVGQTDMMELIIAFNKFSNAPKDQKSFLDSNDSCSSQETPHILCESNVQ